jgi:hypothetical protein
MGRGQSVPEVSIVRAGAGMSVAVLTAPLV